jgi:hypothetical protein
VWCEIQENPYWKRYLMKIFDGSIKLYFRWSVVFVIIIVSSLSCTSPPVAQTERAFTATYTATYAAAYTASPQPSSTSTIKAAVIPTSPATEEFTQPTGIVQPTENFRIDIAAEIIGQVNPDRALADLRKITGEEPICTENGCSTISNRLTGSEGLQRVKDYIYDELLKLGYSLEYQNWSSSGFTDQNLIARKEGITSPEEEIYFVAHMDGVKGNNRERFPGADDNGSGVTDILELARVLSSYSFNRTLVLFFSSGEEQGSLGVKSYLRQLSSSELSSIKYVLDIDMVGYDANRDGVMELWHGGHSPSKDLTLNLSEIISAQGLDLTPKIETGCG